MSERESNSEVFEGLMANCRSTLQLLGEDADREGLLKTPERVAKAMLAVTSGYGEDPQAILRGAMFKEDYSQMVVVKDIDFYSLCEHHILPFFGKVHVAYIPNGYITGLILLLEHRRAEYGNGVLCIAFGDERHGFGYTLRCLDKTFAVGILA